MVVLDESSSFKFLSTPSARRATSLSLPVCSARRFLSTPSARRATDGNLPRHPSEPISIHALREEGDQLSGFFYDSHHKFLSTPSARRATEHRKDRRGLCAISIHALREEGDMYSARAPRTSRHFYPRPPRGGRQLPSAAARPFHQDFYPRPPRGGRLSCKEEQAL